MSTAVYVGRDVTVTIQVPVEKEPHTIPSGSPYTVTLNHSPISDRDLDGVADEVAHVTVEDTNGSPITPASVDDSAGTVTFNSGDAGKNVFISYSYDLNPYLAQEITVEPKQAVEGVDALGSDTIQAWAVLLKEISGSIREVYKPGDSEQLTRIGLAHNPCASGNGGTTTISPGYVTGYPPSRAIDEDLSTETKPSGTAPYDWYLEVTFSEWRRIDEVLLTAAFWHNHNTNLKITYWDGFAWQDYAVFDETLYTHATPETKTFKKTVWTNKLRVQGTLDDQFYTPSIFEVQAYQTEPTVHNLIVSWDQAGQAVKIGLAGVVFPEGSIPSPKNRPVFIVTPFKARQVKTIG